MLRKLCGDDTLQNVAIVTNMWDLESEVKGVIREEELKTDDLFFKPVLEKGAQMLRHNNTLDSARAIVSHFIRKDPLALLIQRELVDEHKDITETAAGVVLQGELANLLEQHRKELQDIRRDIVRAMAEKDVQTRQELDQVRTELERKLNIVQEDKDRLSREYREEKAKADAALRRLEAEFRVEQQNRAKAEQEIQALRGRNHGRAKPEEPRRAESPKQKNDGFFAKMGRAWKKRGSPH